MTKLEFETAQFRKSDRVMYGRKLYPIRQISFDRGLIEIELTDGYFWVHYSRLEHCPFAPEFAEEQP